MPASDRLIVALDVPNKAVALDLVDHLGAGIVWYKVGLELYLAEGAAVVHALNERDKRVFLDLKLHDIPNTVASAVRVAAHTGAELLTVHAAGGPAMIQAAVGAAQEKNALAILAVTVLTSMDAVELRATGVPGEPATQVQRLAQMALEAGAAGLICSPLETAMLRTAHGQGPMLVVPGIRSATEARGDQQRAASAEDAIRNGASRIVVGRPITRAQDPQQAAEDLLRRIESVLQAGCRDSVTNPSR